ncbi:MAG TPA: Gfo/Idh/MocA family oxidoreductase [Roseiflexaceae bacterium]|nr:Gfo/Idh/MocA family oxidoreductase [Roseiflexaceae bacterium]
MTPPVRFGIIGAGAIATRGHIPSLQRVPGAQVVAICDTNLERARQAAAQFNIPHVFSDFRDVVAHAEVDAVTIGVPNAFHAPAALAALEAGKHVLCEKPLATSVADGEAMVAAARRAGRILAVNMSNRPRPEFLALRAAVQEGRLGKVSYALGRMIRRSGIPGFGSWFTRKDLAGGGATMDIGVHMLDAVLWILGFPAVAAVRGEVQAVHGPHERGLGAWGADRVPGGTFDVDDLAVMHLRLADGGLVTVEVTWAFHGRNEERVQLAGDLGGADFFPDLYGKEMPLRLFRVEGDTPVEVIPTLPQVEWAWAQGLVRFTEAVRGQGTPLATGEEGLAVLRLLDAVYRSAAEGREIAL